MTMLYGGDGCAADRDRHAGRTATRRAAADGLPSTPLKGTEKRADAWTRAMGVQQTEIDSLAALQPAVLTQMARDAIVPFFDDALARRVRDIANQWRTVAQQAVDEQGGQQLDQLRIQRRGSAR
jgi:hypothetical protein